jgi:hypothetical protein
VLEKSDDLVDIKDSESLSSSSSSSSSSINMDATSCAFIRRPKHWPVDLRLSVKELLRKFWRTTFYVSKAYFVSG